MNMQKGKYLRTKAKKGKTVILILSLMLLLAVAVGGTVAYLQTTSNRVTNTFTPAEVKITPNEVKMDTTKENITFKNEGSVPVYIRATLVIYWTDLIGGSVQTVAPPPDSSVSVGSVRDGWFQVGDIYYYAQPVAPGSETTVMLETITVTVSDGSTAQCHIDVRAEAIQAEPLTVVESAWTKVKVESNGNLKMCE